MKLIVQRISLFFIFMGLYSLSYQIGALSEIGDEESSAFLEEFGDLIESIDAIGIFANNIILALPMFIPGFGVAWGLFSGWSTGYAFASIIAATPSLSDFPPLGILYSSSFGFLELVAYSIGTSRGYLLIWNIIKRKKLGIDLIPLSVEIAAVFVLIYVGAYLEFDLIKGYL
ncbi:MAG: stage II sporulation protein M [Nitrosarchaeum sp.]